MAAAVFSNKVVRRRAIIYTVLLAVSFVLMAISSSPIIIEMQKGVAYAFSPVQGVLDDTAGGVASIFRTIAEIDTLRQENASLDEENDRLRIENARLEETQRENDLLTGLLQLQAGLDHKTVAASVIAREPAEFRRAVTIDRGSDQGIEQGDVVIGAGGALVGRVVEVGPNYSNVTLLTDGSSTVIGQLVSNAATGEVVGDLGGRPEHDEDRLGGPGPDRRRGRDRGHRAGRRDPLAVPEGPPDRPGHRCPAGRQ